MTNMFTFSRQTSDTSDATRRSLSPPNEDAGAAIRASSCRRQAPPSRVPAGRESNGARRPCLCRSHIVLRVLQGQNGCTLKMSLIDVRAREQVGARPCD
ncbi:unnamed protein product [Arctogadus glacialis]